MTHMAILSAFAAILCTASLASASTPPGHKILTYYKKNEALIKARWEQRDGYMLAYDVSTAVDATQQTCMFNANWQLPIFRMWRSDGTVDPNFCASATTALRAL